MNKEIGDYVCQKCNRGFISIRQRQKNSPAVWVRHACVFCIDKSAAEKLANRYENMWNSGEDPATIDWISEQTLTQIEIFKKRMSYITGE